MEGTMGEWMIWTGAAVTLVGVAGLIGCIVHVLRLRRAGLDEGSLRSALQRAVAWNLGALGVSVLGLMLVILGLAF